VVSGGAETDQAAAGATQVEPVQRGGSIPAQGKRSAALGKRAAPVHLQTTSEAPGRPGLHRGPPDNKHGQVRAPSKPPDSKGHWAGVGGCTSAERSGSLAAPGWSFRRGAGTDWPAAGATHAGAPRGPNRSNFEDRHQSRPSKSIWRPTAEPVRSTGHGGVSSLRWCGRFEFRCVVPLDLFRISRLVLRDSTLGVARLLAIEARRSSSLA